ERGFQQRPLSDADRKSREIVLALPLGRMKRARGEKLDVVEIQIHRSKPRFVLAFGVVPAEGVRLPWATLSQSEASVGDLLENCRLYDNRPLMKWFGLQWFTFNSDSTTIVTKSIDRAIGLYPEVEQYFHAGLIGSHIKCLCYSIDSFGKLNAA